MRFAGEICTSGRGEIKLREWPQNDSIVLFNDSNQHYSVIPETHFREAEVTMSVTSASHRSAKPTFARCDFPQVIRGR